MFDNIIGYDYVKKELELIISWYNNDKYLNNKNAKLPSGIIFYGPPGNGKTFFIRELVNQFKDNSFIIDGDKSNILDEITSIYKKARNNKLSLVLIDEIDLLIDKDTRAIRVLQDELDGVNRGEERILTIATTNEIYNIPDPLLRTGRFDRMIRIDNPNEEDKKELLNYYFNKLDIKTNFIDYNNVIYLLGRKSCSDIMSICNDCYFRFNEEVITEEKIIKSISKLDSDASNFMELKTKEVAYHEIGHYLMVRKHSKYFNAYEVKFTDSGGICKFGEKDNIFRSTDMALANIEIGLGGVAAEKVLCGSISIGAEDDLSSVRNKVNRYVNRYPYKSISTVLKEYNTYGRMETEKTRYKNEKLANKILVKCYKNAVKYLKKHKKEIIKYGDILFEKGYLLASDFEVVN